MGVFFRSLRFLVGKLGIGDRRLKLGGLSRFVLRTLGGYGVGEDGAGGRTNGELDGWVSDESWAIINAI